MNKHEMRAIRDMEMKIESARRILTKLGCGETLRRFYLPGSPEEREVIQEQIQGIDEMIKAAGGPR
jgi:hypothetical protein